MKLNELSTYQSRLKQAAAKGFDESEIWYHGSPEKFNSFGKQRTSYGFFVTHDPDTAKGYSNDHSTTANDGYIYRVILKVDKVLDITEGIPVEIAQEMFQSEPEYDKEEAYKFIAAMYEANVSEVVQWINSLSDDPNDEVEDVLNWENLDAAEIYDWVKNTHNGKLLSQFESDVEKKWQEYEWLQNAYENESNSFYLDYQNDVLHAAEALGYDAVDMMDPSSSGEPFSRVVFDGNNIFIISRRSAEADIDDEINSRYG